MRNHHHTYCHIALIGCALLWLTGCSKDEAATPDPGPVQPVPTVPVPTGGSKPIPPGTTVEISSDDTRTISIHGDRAVSLQLTQSAYDDYLQRRNVQGITPILYATFRDDFDFITLLINEDNVPPSFGAVAFYNPARNDVQNIGLTTFDNTTSYGSAGKLQGVLILGGKSHLRKGPSLHEICHQWANYLIPTEFPGSAIGPHWGISGGNSRGQLGGFVQSTLSDTRTAPPSPNWSASDFAGQTLGGNSGPYNQMELYLMGMIPLEDVDPFDVFLNVRDIITDGRFVAWNSNTKINYTAEKIRDEFGIRLPLPADAQKDFRMLVVMLTPQPLTDAEWLNFNDQVFRFGIAGDDGEARNYNFWEATGGRATMKVDELSNSLIP